MVGWKSDNMNSGTLGFCIALWRGLGVGGGGGVKCYNNNTVSCAISQLIDFNILSTAHGHLWTIKLCHKLHRALDN